MPSYSVRVSSKIPVTTRSAIRAGIPAKRRYFSSLQLGEYFKAIIREVCPSILLSYIREQRQRWKRRPPIGWVRFGSFRRLKPIAPEFGWKWGDCIDRYYIDSFLARHARNIHGRVLEVADTSYTYRFGGQQVAQADVLHSIKGDPKVTIVADLTCAAHIPSDSYDCIILTQTLQFIYDVRAALQTLYRILKPGGTLLVTCHGISQISRYDMDHWGEYWRFTSLSARRLFTEVFPEDCVTIQPYGNVLAAIAFLHGLMARELSRKELDYQDQDYELLLGIRAEKPLASNGKT